MSQLGIVVAAHGDLGRALVSSAEMIVGAQTEITSVCLGPGDDLEGCLQEMLHALERVDHGQGAIVLIDLYGGTPSNAALLGTRGRLYPVVSGTNLPMLLEVLMNRDTITNQQELAALALKAGHDGIMDVSAQLKLAQGTFPASS